MSRADRKPVRDSFSLDSLAYNKLVRTATSLYMKCRWVNCFVSDVTGCFVCWIYSNNSCSNQLKYHNNSQGSSVKKYFRGMNELELKGQTQTVLRFSVNSDASLIHTTLKAA